jgi:hypothetical protein
MNAVAQRQGAGGVTLAAEHLGGERPTENVAQALGSGVGGVGVNADSHTAMIAAINDCVAHGGDHCTYYGDTENGCIALAVQGTKLWATGVGPFIFLAQRSAPGQNPGGHIATSGCTNSRPTVAKLPVMAPSAVS